uniref:Homeobox protein 5 n=1 Tax=Parastrongyloides trichosuri TaxID=131310 RepID=A0A0N4ZWY4_PARTI
MEDYKITEKSLNIVCENKRNDITTTDTSPSKPNTALINLNKNGNRIEIKSISPECNENMTISSLNNSIKTCIKNDDSTGIVGATNDGIEVKNNQISSQTHKGRWECVDITQNDDGGIQKMNEKIFVGEDSCDGGKVCGKLIQTDNTEDLNEMSIEKNQQNALINGMTNNHHTEIKNVTTESINQQNSSSIHSALPPQPNGSTQVIKNCRNGLPPSPLTIIPGSCIIPSSSTVTTPTNVLTNSFPTISSQFQNINGIPMVSTKNNCPMEEGLTNFSTTNIGDKSRLGNTSPPAIGNVGNNTGVTNKSGVTNVNNSQCQKKISITSVTSCNDNTTNLTKANVANGMTSLLGFFDKNGENDGNNVFKDDGTDKGDDHIGSKINQAMDLVKFHLSRSIRQEYDQLNAQIAELKNKVQVLECQNNILKSFAPEDIVQNLYVLSKTNNGATTTSSTSTSSTNNAGTVVNTENVGLSRNSSTNNFMASPGCNNKPIVEANNKDTNIIHTTPQNITNQQQKPISTNIGGSTPSPPNGVNFNVINGGQFEEHRLLQNVEENNTYSTTNVSTQDIQIQRKISGASEHSNGFTGICSIQNNSIANINENNISSSINGRKIGVSCTNQGTTAATNENNKEL